MHQFTETMQAMVQDACKRKVTTMEDLAGVLGKHVGSLYCELNPMDERYKLGLDDAFRIMQICQNFEPLKLMAGAAGLTVFQESCGASAGLVQSVLALVGSVGGVSDALSSALSDGHIDRHEHQVIVRNLMQCVNALQTAVASTIEREVVQ